MNAVADLLLPPASLVVIGFVLLAGHTRFRRLGLLALALFLALGTGLVSTALLNSLAPGEPAPGPEPGAIVILSADGVLMPGLPLEPGALTLERLRAGVILHRRTQLPVLVTGGPFLGSNTSLADMMSASARQDFGIDVRWEERQSLDTWQNAQYSAKLLAADGIRRVYLVTHIWHMRRAMLAFRHFGLDPVPAPVRPPGHFYWSWYLATVHASAWTASYYALHEWIGLAYYALRG